MSPLWPKRKPWAGGPSEQVGGDQAGRPIPPRSVTGHKQDQPPGWQPPKGLGTHVFSCGTLGDPRALRSLAGEAALSCWQRPCRLAPGILLGEPRAWDGGLGRTLPWEPVVRESLTWARSVSPGSYAHALDGLYRVAREEGLKKLFSGATMASSRGVFVTVGQLSCYDQAKQLVLSTGYLSDGIVTHFVASFIAGGCATFLCQPLDVLKTRLMNSKGEYRGVFHCAVETAKLGPLAFYKGLLPAAIRLMPHTVLTFVFLEQLRKHFGIKVPS